MSLLINGLDMPKCCCDCYLYDSAGFCALDPTREFEDYNCKRPDDCYLIHLHDDRHYIDADRLIAFLQSVTCAYDMVPIMNIIDTIESQPDITEV